MSPSAERHMQKYRCARTATLVWLEKRDETTSKLQREIEAQAAAAKRVNEYRDSIGYVSWTKRAKDALSEFVKGWWAV